MSRCDEVVPPVHGVAQKPKPVKMFMSGRHAKHHRHLVRTPVTRRQWSLSWRINDLLFELGFSVEGRGG
jgi:hypothetical protein